MEKPSSVSKASRGYVQDPSILEYKLITWSGAVDGGAWRTHGGDPGSGFSYPKFLLSDQTVSGVKGGKKSKL